MAFISIVPNKPSDILSASSESLSGATIDKTAPKTAKIKAIATNILYLFNSKNSLLIAPLKSFAFSTGAPFPRPLPIGPLGIF